MDRKNNQAFLTTLKKIILAPLILLIIGNLLSLLFLVNTRYQLHAWNDFFALTSKAGHIIIVLAFIFFIYNIVAAICQQYKNKYLAGNKEIAHQITLIIYKELRVIFILFALYTVISLLGLSKQDLNIVDKAFYVAIVCLIGWTSLQILTAIEAVVYKYSAAATHANARKRKALYTKVHIIKNVIVTLIIILTVAAALMVFDQVKSLGISLLASAGFLTALLGLAAQRSLGSMFAGIQLALSQPIKIDDVVIIDNEQGIIEEITLSYVTVKLWDMRRIIMPISYFIEKPFQNLTRTGSNLIGAITIYADYMLPIDAMRDELRRILSTSTTWDKKTEAVQVLNFKETCIELRILISAESPDHLSQLRLDVREKLLAFIRQHHADCLPKQRVENLSLLSQHLP